MNEMEKVIKGLEACSLAGTKEDCIGYGCPYIIYNDEVSDDCQEQMFDDALALLKAQEPRVIALEEYKALAEKAKEERDPVWEEWPRLKCTWEIPNQAYGGYGTSWRCWTSRPTDEQREATPWN